VDSESQQLLERIERLAAAIEKQSESTNQAVQAIALLLDVLAGDEEEHKQPPEHL